MARTAAFVTPGRSLEQAVARVRAAEELGYELALATHIANRDALITLAAYGQATSTIRLGTGVYPALHQTALSLGHQAATLDEIIGGRLVLGIGTSHRPVVEGWHGVDFPDSPLTAMRERVDALRQLFTQHRAQVDGEYVRVGGFQFHGFEPRGDIPILLSALGPKMLELAGEVADGVVLWLTEPGYVADTVVPHLRTGAERAGRDPADLEIIAAITCAVTDEPGGALARFRRTLVPYLSLPFYRAMLERAGHADDLERFDAGMADRDTERALAGVSDDLVHAVAGIGPVGQVQETVQRYRDAGVTLPGVAPLTTDGTASFEDTLAVVVGR